MRDNSALFANRKIDVRLSRGDVVRVRHDADYRAGETAIANSPPDGNGRVNLTFVDAKEASRLSRSQRASAVPTLASEDWGLAEIDLGAIDRLEEATYDRDFDAYHAATMAYDELVGANADKWANGNRKGDYEAYQAFLERSVPREPSQVVETRPDLAAKFARIEAESALFYARREEARKLVDECARLARYALGRYAARRFLELAEDGVLVPAQVFDRVLKEASELRRRSLDGVDSRFEDTGVFMQGFGTEFAEAKGIRTKPSRSADLVRDRILQPVYAVVEADDRSAFLQMREWTGHGGPVRVAQVEGVEGRRVRYALRIEGERAAEFLDATKDDVSIVSMNVRDPTFRDAPVDGAYPGLVALHVMEDDRLAGEAAYLEFHARAGDRKAIEEWNLAKEIVEEAKVVMAP